MTVVQLRPRIEWHDEIPQLDPTKLGPLQPACFYVEGLGQTIAITSVSDAHAHASLFPEGVRADLLLWLKAAFMRRGDSVIELRPIPSSGCTCCGEGAS